MEAVKTTAMLDDRGLKYVKQYGFIPADSMIESVAMGMEYAIADAVQPSAMAYSIPIATDSIILSAGMKPYCFTYFNPLSSSMAVVFTASISKRCIKPFYAF